MKANRHARNLTDDDAALVEGAGFMISGMLMLMLGIIVNLSLLPGVEESVAQVKANPNSTSSVKNIAAIHPIVFVALPLLGIAGIGYGGYQMVRGSH